MEKDKNEQKKIVPKMNEKSVQVLGCALAVAILIVLMSGDMIITKFLKVKPNQEYPKVNQPEIPLPEEDLKEYLLKTDLKTVMEKIEANEKVLVISANEECSPCQKFVPVLKSVVNEKKIKTYYLERKEVVRDDNYEKLIQMDPFIELSFGTTPFLMLFQDGSYKNGISGMMQDEETLKNALNELIFSGYQK